MNDEVAGSESEETRFGQYLKRERELRQIELSFVADYTRVNQERLQRLEAGDWTLFGAAIYLRGAVSNYARAIGLDVDDTLVRLESEVPSYSDTTALNVNRDSPVFRTEPGEPTKFSALGSALIKGLLIGVLVAVLAWFAFKREWSNWSEPAVQGPSSTAVSDDQPVALTDPAIHSAVTTTPNIATTAATKHDAPDTTTSVPEADAESEKHSAGQTKDHKFIVRALEESWIEYAVDDAEPRDVILRQGERISLDAAHKVFFRTGNAGGIELEIDGDPIAPLGATGVVRARTFILE